MLFRTGRISLLIGLVFLGSSILVADSSSHFAPILREGVSIGGWVAMWRPLEIFLDDRWPLTGEARLADRLAVIPGCIRYVGQTSTSGA